MAVLTANLTATLFLPVPVWPGSEVLVSVGTLIFGITFTQRDQMHQHGRAFVYRVILLAAVLNLLLMASVRFIWGVPATEGLRSTGWDWLADGVAMLTENGWRVFLASFLATVLAESADTEVFHRLRERSWWVRVFRSNAVSIPVDSLLFNLIAFAGSVWFPIHILLQVIAGEIVAKFLVGALYAVFLGKMICREPLPFRPNVD